MAKAPKVLILNGPNLNMLGSRQPDVYGRETLADIEKSCRRHGKDRGLNVDCRQSNSEGELVGWIQDARNAHDGIVINPGAYSHTSIAIMDAILAVGLPLIEVHLSNIHRRESFRHHSYVSKAADAVICGLGPQGYLMALDAMARRLIAEQET
ncbi:MAG: type II 3-dehydroquinate dehydratase [Kiloniellaceae bacterium]